MVQDTVVRWVSGKIWKVPSLAFLHIASDPEGLQRPLFLNHVLPSCLRNEVLEALRGEMTHAK